MKIELGKYIADLLREHNRVSLPGIGAFVGNYKPAVLNEETLELAPPYKEITFSKDETWNDELLENLVSKAEELSTEEAKKAVAESIEEIVAELQKTGVYTFDGLGQLVNDGWIFSVQLEEGLNLLTESYGLETISMPTPTIQPAKKVTATPPVTPPASTQEQTPKPTTTTPSATSVKTPQNSTVHKSKTHWVLLCLLLIIVALASFLYFDGFFGTTSDAPQPMAVTVDSTAKVTEPEDSSYTQNYSDTVDVDTVEQKIVAEKIESQTEKRKALYYEEPKTTSNGKKTFYIIAGSFNKMENAEKLKQALVKEGFKPEIITVEGPTFRVSLYSFTNRNRALQELARLRDQNKERNIWLLGL